MCAVELNLPELMIAPVLFRIGKLRSPVITRRPS
jgi:hypothetical protein